MLSRETLKRNLPSPVLRALLRVRDKMKGPPFIETVLHDTLFTPDPDPAPRVTLIMPNLAASKAFGGVMTALTLAADLRERLEGDGITLRIASEDPVNADDLVLDKVPGLAGVDVVSLADTGRKLPLRAREMCVAYTWWISGNLESALAGQAKHFGQPPFPRVHIIQEYEPQFYPFSASNLLAHQAVGLGDALWAVFNTAELFEYWKLQGHEAAKTFVFEPRMNAALRPFADDLKGADKTRTILVYGRPTVARNAFFLIRRGLEAWGETYGRNHSDWRIVSAGMAHEDMPLGGGHMLRSVGKLSLDDYAGLLRETAIGLSLMVSPHPSYPPLEMAHFGARVLTNGYTGKVPGSRHDNLISLPGMRPEEVAAAIEAEITAFEANPDIGVSGKSHMQSFVGADEIECADAVADALRDAIGGSERK